MRCTVRHTNQCRHGAFVAFFLTYTICIHLSVGMSIWSQRTHVQRGNLRSKLRDTKLYVNVMSMYNEQT